MRTIYLAAALFCCARCHNAAMPVQYLTATPFKDWDSNTVNAAKGQQLDQNNLKALTFYRGDHWQNGEGWAGPKLDPITTAPDEARAFLVKVQDAFTSSNILGEVVDRHVSAVFGRPPAWQFLPLTAPEGDDEDAEKDPLVVEVEAALVNWLDKRNAHQYILEAAAELVAGSMGNVRLFVPPGLLADGPEGSNTKIVPTGLTLEEALDLVYIEKIAAEAGGAAYDRNTMTQAAFTLWNETVQEGTGQQSRQRTELQYTELNGRKSMTVLRTWTLTELDGTLTLDLGGNLLMHQMRGRPIVTTQLMQLQKAHNFALTAMGRNNANAGFMERIITNAQPVGEYKTVSGSAQKVWVPGPYKGGPNATVFLQGHPMQDPETQAITGYTNPGVIYRDPSSPEAFKASLDEYRSAIYLEAKQGHLLAQGDGSASAASRVHMRADFEVSLRDTKVAAEDSYRWLLTVLAKLGAIFSGQGGRYDALRVTVQANVNTGPLTDPERAAILQQYKEGLRSRESAMEMLGIDDPDAEFVRIMAEKQTNPVALETLALLGAEMLPEQMAELMRRAGLEVTPEQLAKMQADAASKAQMLNQAALSRSKALNPGEGASPPASDAGG